MTPLPRGLARLWPVALTVLCVLAILHLRLDPTRLVAGAGNLAILWREAFPPQGGLLGTAWLALVETLTIALLGTVFGFFLALPLGVAGARTLAPRWLFLTARGVAAAIRSLPSLLWAVLFVILVGFDPLAGVLAMTMYTVGHLAKLQYECLEAVAPEPVEAARAIGASGFQVVRFVVLPEASNQLLSQALYMFDYNVRASSIVGFVGAGGIGFYIARYLQALQYDGVLTLVLVVFAAVVAIDALSYWLRARFVAPGAGPVV